LEHRASLETVRIPGIAPDGSLFPVEKMRAHRDGIRHLAISIFVFSGDDLLIQRRAASKYHCGLQWANTCCTHPNWEEPLEQAAPRRLHEELGIDLALRPASIIDYRADVTAGLVEHERVQVFAGITDRKTLMLAPNPDEVCETRWASVPDLAAEAAAAPECFAPWFRIYLDRWDELGL
jgi:isopentenyl-diphosphate delta-isomerase